jgi:formamidopyrimidine-DNA glycosylase
VPELPFLEILVENLAAHVSGRRIEAFEIRQPALLQTAAPDPATFHGEYLSLPTRTGKYVVLETESRRAIVIHLMRLGRLQAVQAAQAADPGVRGGAGRAAGGARAKAPPKNLSARIRFDDASELRLIEHGTEKRARLWLADDLDAISEISSVGPDPSRGELARDAFLAALRAESRQLKTFLTDQRALSGIGNGLADEILYEARLSPLALTGRTSDDEAGRLYAAVLSVVEEQIGRLRDAMAGALPQKEPSAHYAVHDHAGEACRRCGAAIARISYATRETFYCPGCQTGGKPLKDRRLSRLLR